MKWFMRVIAAAAVFATLSGCGASASNNPQTPDTNPAGYFRVTTVNVNGHDVTCVTWHQGYAGGLSCDWGATK